MNTEKLNLKQRAEKLRTFGLQNPTFFDALVEVAWIEKILQGVESKDEKKAANWIESVEKSFENAKAYEEEYARAQSETTRVNALRVKYEAMSCFAILDIPEGTQDKDLISKKHRMLMRLYHPDTVLSGGFQLLQNSPYQVHRTMIQQLIVAYDELTKVINNARTDAESGGRSQANSAQNTGSQNTAYQYRADYEDQGQQYNNYTQEQDQAHYYYDQQQSQGHEQEDAYYEHSAQTEYGNYFYARNPKETNNPSFITTFNDARSVVDLMEAFRMLDARLKLVALDSNYNEFWYTPSQIILAIDTAYKKLKGDRSVLLAAILNVPNVFGIHERVHQELISRHIIRDYWSGIEQIKSALSTLKIINFVFKNDSDEIVTTPDQILEAFRYLEKYILMDISQFSVRKVLEDQLAVIPSIYNMDLKVIRSLLKINPYLSVNPDQYRRYKVFISKHSNV